MEGTVNLEQNLSRMKNQFDPELQNNETNAMTWYHDVGWMGGNSYQCYRQLS